MRNEDKHIFETIFRDIIQNFQNAQKIFFFI